MKIKVLTFFFTLFCLQTNLLGQAAEIKLQLKGYTEGGGLCRLIGMFGDQNYVADTATLSKTGLLTFERAEGYKNGMYFILLPDKSNLQILFVKEEPRFSLIADFQKPIETAQIVGSAENTLLYESLKYQIELEKNFGSITQQLRNPNLTPSVAADLQQQQRQLLAERDEKIQLLKKNYPNNFFTKFKLAGQNPKLQDIRRANGSLDTIAQMYVYRQAFWENFDFSDERLMRTPVFSNKLKRFIKDLTFQQPDSVINSAAWLIEQCRANKWLFEFAVNWIATQYKPAQSAMMDAEKVQVALIDRYFTPELAKWSTPENLKSIHEEADKMRQSFLGMVGQNVWGIDPEGKKHSLYDLKTNFKIVYIYTPDCEHCQAETPKLRQVYDEWREKGLSIFSIASMAEREKWKNFRQKYGVNWIDVIDPQLESQYNLKYYIDITPEIYLLDKNNIIIAKNLKPEQIAEVLRKAMNQ